MYEYTCMKLHDTDEGYKTIISFFKPGKGRLWARAWFTEIVFVKVCVCVPIYLSTYLPVHLSMFIRTHPREQNH